MTIDAVYFDGEVARDRAVTLRKVGSDLEFVGPDTALTRWSIKGLHPIDPPSPGQPFRITHQSKPGSRLVLRDQAFIDELVRENSALKGGYGLRHVGQVLAWTVAGLAVAAGLFFFTMNYLPDRVASIMPDSMRNNMGDQIVKSLVADAKKCSTPEGDKAISAMINALAEGQPELPPISVEVYNIPIMNAFAAPGGRIIFTYQLIKEASKPSEVTGVLAHEIGHVAYRHPEAQMVRIAGMQILMSAITGGGSDMLGSAASIAAILRYTREAEREADLYAREKMLAASVDPTGLRDFFQKILKLEKPGDTPPKPDTQQSMLDRIGNVFSTHPGTEERIKEIQPLPSNLTPVEIMTHDQWKALQTICE